MGAIAKTLKVPPDLWEAFQSLISKGQALDGYPSANAAMVGVLRYTVAFPREHTLTAGIARLPLTEQDEIDAFLLRCTADGTDLRTLLPKNPKAADLLALARTQGKPQRE